MNISNTSDLIKGQLIFERRTLLSKEKWTLIDQNELWRFLPEKFSSEKHDWVIPIDRLKQINNDSRLYALYREGLKKAIEHLEKNNESEITLYALENFVQPRAVSIRYLYDQQKKLPR